MPCCFCFHHRFLTRVPTLDGSQIQISSVCFISWLDKVHFPTEFVLSTPKTFDFCLFFFLKGDALLLYQLPGELFSVWGCYSVYTVTAAATATDCCCEVKFIVLNGKEPSSFVTDHSGPPEDRNMSATDETGCNFSQQLVGWSSHHALQPGW